MEQCNENSCCVVTVIFLDEDRKVITPSAATYTLHDVATGDSIISPTPVPAPTAGTYDIVIPDTANVIIDDTRSYEVKVLTVYYTYATGNATAEYRYKVKNLLKVS